MLRPLYFAAVVLFLKAYSFTFTPTTTVRQIGTKKAIRTHNDLDLAVLRMTPADANRPIVKSLLDRVNSPSDMKNMDLRDLKQVSKATAIIST